MTRGYAESNAKTVGITPVAAMNNDPTDAMATTLDLGGGRRRSQRACEMCYRKKIRCEVEASGLICVQCVRRNTQCVFPVWRETTPGLQSDQYVKSLKDRLDKIESLLKTAGILNEADLHDDLSGDEDELSYDDWAVAHERSKSVAYSSDDSYASLNPSSCDTTHFPGGGDLTPLFKQHEKDDSRYFGRSCSLSILSRGGIEWIKSKTGDVSFLNIVSPDSVHYSPWSAWRPDVFHDLFASKVFKPLPSRSEVFSLIEVFFQTANRLFPIYHKESFMKMVEWQYTQQTCDDAARWASINMVICLAYEFRFSNTLKPEKDRENARLYFKNAMSVFTELALRRTDLLSVQALLSMAFFLRGNSGTQSALPFLTAAMRSCQRMGLHRNIPRPDLSPTEQEQRRRVFWVAFTVDQSTCLRAGNAPSQHPDDFDVPLPEESDDDKKPGSSNVPFFRQLCRMALVKTRIYCRLYSAKALVKPPREIFQTVKQLHAELEDLKKDYPFNEEPTLDAAGKDFLFKFASVGLHFVYYNALIMIHRIPLLLNYLITSRDEPEDLKSLSEAHAAKSSAICVQAARDTLRMVKDMPWGDVAWIWSLLYYVFLSAATIFSNIIRDTRHAQVREDLASLNMAAKLFASLVPGDGPANYAGFMTRMSATLERIARIAVDKDEKRAGDRDGRDQENQQPGTKRHNNRTTSTSHPKTRHGPSTLWTSMASNASDSRLATAPSASNAPSNNPNLPDLDIPDALEGFPPVNSCGYVVPMSPGPPNTFSTSMNNQPPSTPTTTTYPAGLGLTNLNHPLPNRNSLQTNIRSWHLSQDHNDNHTHNHTHNQTHNHTHNHTQTHQNTTNTTSPVDQNNPQSQSLFSQPSHSAPVPTTTTTTTIPDSWQVPLTASWSYGDNLWAGLFPTEALAASAQQQHLSFPILSAESFLTIPPGADNTITEPEPAYTGGPSMAGYGFSAGTGAQGSSRDADQGESLWPNGVLGLF